LFAELGLTSYFQDHILGNLTDDFVNFAKSTAYELLTWVPIVGPLVEAFNDLDNGNYGWAAFNAGTAIVDLLTLGAGGRVLTAVRKGLTGPMRVVAYQEKFSDVKHFIYKIGDKWYDSRPRNGKFSIDLLDWDDEDVDRIGRLGETLVDIEVPWANIARAGHGACGTGSINCAHGVWKALNNGHYQLENFSLLSLGARAFESLFEPEG
jgi:hypothetical protein